MAIFVQNFYSKVPNNAIQINTTSRAKSWQKGLSPFYLGPVKLYNNFESKNVENAWQFCKVYKKFITNNEITQEYFDWAIAGWNDTFAHRYPMGKNAIPEFSLWENERLGYIDARKKIYIPLYSSAVLKSEAFDKLYNLCLMNKNKDIYLLDFDAYNYKELGMSIDDVINCKSRKMGHAFVLAMLLNFII